MTEVYLLGVTSGFAIFESYWAFQLMDRAGALVALLLGVKCVRAWQEVFHGEI
jgi:hypothetical protein